MCLIGIYNFMFISMFQIMFLKLCWDTIQITPFIGQFIMPIFQISHGESIIGAKDHLPNKTIFTIRVVWTYYAMFKEGISCEWHTKRRKESNYHKIQTIYITWTFNSNLLEIVIKIAYSCLNIEHVLLCIIFESMWNFECVQIPCRFGVVFKYDNNLIS